MRLYYSIFNLYKVAATQYLIIERMWITLVLWKNGDTKQFSKILKYVLIILKQTKLKYLSIYPYRTLTKLAPSADYLAITGSKPWPIGVARRQATYTE